MEELQAKISRMEDEICRKEVELTAEEHSDILLVGKQCLLVDKQRLLVQEEQLAALKAASAARGAAGAGAGAAAGPGSGSPAAHGGSNMLPWAVGVPFMMLVLVVDRGVSIFDDATQCVKVFVSRNDVALAATYKGIRGVGLLATAGLGVAAAVGACLERLRVYPGRPRVLRSMRPKQRLDLAPASAAASADAGLARDELPAQTSASGQVDR